MAEGPFSVFEAEPVGEGPSRVFDLLAALDPNAPPPVTPGIPDLNYGPRDRLYARLMPLWG